MEARKKKAGRLGRPPAFLWYLAYIVLRPYYALRYGMRIDRRGVGKIRGPALILAPHTAEADPFLIAMALYPHRPNFVVSAHFMANPKLRRLFKLLRVIPKRMFSADPSTILNIGRAKREGNLVVLFPEGRLPCSGHSVPVTAGTEALIRRLGIDVYVVTCHGAYLTFPKWSSAKRRGKIRVEVRRLFEGASLPSLDEREIKERLASAISHNDEAAMTGIAYRTKTPALGVDGILFRCPECGGELTLTTTADGIHCTCGASVRLLPDYRLLGSRFSTLGEWFLWQKEVLDTSRPLSADVIVGTPDEAGYMNEQAGEGHVTFTREAITFSGTVNGEPCAFTLPTDKVGGIPITVARHFDVYHNNRLYYFYPQPDERLAVKWVIYFDKLLEERNALSLQNS